jgi:hypothetical protein
MTRAAVAIAADRRTLKFALAQFEPRDLSELLADALVQRFGRNRAEMILEDARKECVK